MGPAAEELSKYKDTKSHYYELFESNIAANSVKMVHTKRGLFAEFNIKAALIAEYSSLMLLKLWHMVNLMLS